jgi:hypothetical protein
MFRVNLPDFSFVAVISTIQESPKQVFLPV